MWNFRDAYINWIDSTKRQKSHSSAHKTKNNIHSARKARHNVLRCDPFLRWVRLVCVCAAMAKAKSIRENQRKIFCTSNWWFSLILDFVEIRLTTCSVDGSTFSKFRRTKRAQWTKRQRLCAKTHGSVQPCAYLFSAMLNAIYDTIIYQTFKKISNQLPIVGWTKTWNSSGRMCSDMYAFMCLYVYRYWIPFVFIYVVIH